MNDWFLSPAVPTDPTVFPTDNTTLPTDFTTDFPPTCTDDELFFPDGNTYFTESGEEVFSGTVYVCFKGAFGAVCGQGWDDNDARVACRNRGFPDPSYSKSVCLILYVDNIG